MKLSKPTKEQVIEAVKGGVVMAGTACAGFVAAACVKRIMPQQEKKILKVATAVGSFLICATVEKKVEGYLKNEVDEWEDLVKMSIEEFKERKIDRGPKPEYTKFNNIIEFEDVENAGQTLDQLRLVIEDKGKVTYADLMNMFDMEKVTEQNVPEEIMDMYGWTDLTIGVGIQGNTENGRGALILPPCVYFGGEADAS